MANKKPRWVDMAEIEGKLYYFKDGKWLPAVDEGITEIKTINGQSLEGEGDIVIEGGGGGEAASLPKICLDYTTVLTADDQVQITELMGLAETQPADCILQFRSVLEDKPVIYECQAEIDWTNFPPQVSFTTPDGVFTVTQEEGVLVKKFENFKPNLGLLFTQDGEYWVLTNRARTLDFAAAITQLTRDGYDVDGLYEGNLYAQPTYDAFFEYKGTDCAAHLAFNDVENNKMVLFDGYENKSILVGIEMEEVTHSIVFHLVPDFTFWNNEAEYCSMNVLYSTAFSSAEAEDITFLLTSSPQPKYAVLNIYFADDTRLVQTTALVHCFQDDDFFEVDFVTPYGNIHYEGEVSYYSKLIDLKGLSQPCAIYTDGTNVQMTLSNNNAFFPDYLAERGFENVDINNEIDLLVKVLKPIFYYSKQLGNLYIDPNMQMAVQLESGETSKIILLSVGYQNAVMLNPIETKEAWALEIDLSGWHPIDGGGDTPAQELPELGFDAPVLIGNDTNIVHVKFPQDFDWQEIYEQSWVIDEHMETSEPVWIPCNVLLSETKGYQQYLVEGKVQAFLSSPPVTEEVALPLKALEFRSNDGNYDIIIKFEDVVNPEGLNTMEVSESKMICRDQDINYDIDWALDYLNTHQGRTIYLIRKVENIGGKEIDCQTNYIEACTLNKMFIDSGNWQFYNAVNGQQITNQFRMDSTDESGIYYVVAQQDWDNPIVHVLLVCEPMM